MMWMSWMPWVTVVLCVNGFPLSYDILWWLEMDEIWLFKGIDRDLSRREINSLDIIITRVKYFNCSISCNLVPGIYKKKMVLVSGLTP